MSLFQNIKMADQVQIMAAVYSLSIQLVRQLEKDYEPAEAAAFEDQFDTLARAPDTLLRFGTTPPTEVVDALERYRADSGRIPRPPKPPVSLEQPAARSRALSGQSRFYRVLTDEIVEVRNDAALRDMARREMAMPEEVWNNEERWAVDYPSEVTDAKEALRMMSIVRELEGAETRSIEVQVVDLPEDVVRDVL